MRATAYCDGRGNCTTGSCGTFIVLDGGEIIEEARFLGEVSNNVAEYEGAILAIKIAIEHGVTDLEILSDSKLIVNQIQENWKIRQPALVPFRDQVWKAAERLSSVKIKWIPREKNKRADQLCRDISKPVRTPVAERVRRSRRD